MVRRLNFSTWEAKAVLSGILLYALARTGALAQVQRRLDLPAKGGSHAAGNA